MSSVFFEVEVASENTNLKESESVPSVSMVWTVSQLTRHIRLSLEKQFRSLLLEGELSNFKRSAQGHLYFQIKDSRSQIRGIMFRQSTTSLRFEPTDGLEVVVQGHITVYEPRGEYQIQVSSMEPKGLGSLQLAFEQLKEKLEREGLFDSSHKQKIPFFPRRIGIVTSSTGAVIHDMLQVLKRRCPIVSVLFYPAAVQGEQAKSSLVEAINHLNTLQESQQIDVLIVGRGGGSIEDLWAFNEEEVARVIFHSKIPVISAVGHETDFTIADFVSDLRAPTPSVAMELAVPSLQDLLDGLSVQQQRLQRAMQQQIQQNLDFVHARTHQLRIPDFIIHQHKQRLDELSLRLHHHITRPIQTQEQNLRRLHEQLVLLIPLQTVRLQQYNLARLEERLHFLLENQFQQNRERLNQLMALLDSLSPLMVMKRGYGVLLNNAAQSIHSVDSIEVGEALSIHLQDGILNTIVQNKTKKSRE